MSHRHAVRRLSRFAVAAIIALAVASLGQQAVRAQTLEKIRLAGVQTDDLTPVYYAEKAGLYQKAGIDVEIVPTSSGTAATTALVSGAYEMSKGSLISGLVAHLRDLPLVMVANGAIWDPKVPFSMLLVAADSTIKTGADLNGKTIGVPALNDLNTLVSSAWVDKNGGDSKTLKFVEIPNSVEADALASHRIDATVMQDPQMAAAVDSGKAREVAPAYSAVSTHFVFGAYFANKDWAVTHVNAIRTFTRVTYQAAAYTNAHHAETAAMMADVTKIPLAVFQKMGRVDGATTSDPSLIQPLIDAAAKYKQIPRAFPAKEMFFDPAAK
jgi:NitT/TauT family transport system substrate-binding protein